MFEIRELRREMPLIPDDTLMVADLSVIASGSVGSRYMMSYSY
jgi:hypothetical protein